MKLNHKQKVRKARKMMSQMEKSQHYFLDGAWHRKPKTPLFLSARWSQAKQAKAVKEQAKFQYSKRMLADTKIEASPVTT